MIAPCARTVKGQDADTPSAPMNTPIMYRKKSLENRVMTFRSLGGTKFLLQKKLYPHLYFDWGINSNGVLKRYSPFFPRPFSRKIQISDQKNVEINPTAIELFSKIRFNLIDLFLSWLKKVKLHKKEKEKDNPPKL